MTDDERIARALDWAKGSQVADFENVTAQDCSIRERRIHHSDHAGGGAYGGMLEWDEVEWTVTLPGGWAVDLDSMAVPKAPPHRTR